jgi:hypothetical protein
MASRADWLFISSGLSSACSMVTSVYCIRCINYCAEKLRILSIHDWGFARG